MSVTFAVEGLDGHYEAHEHDEYCFPDAARCKGEFVTDGVNVSNVNAAMLLGHLGFDIDDLVGAHDAQDFRARCEIALVQTDFDGLDHGIADVADRGANGARIIECGIPAGYLASRLGELAEIAEQAASLGLRVTWA